MEIVPPDVSKRELLEESNYRSSKAGYTTRTGGPIPLKIQNVVLWGQTKLNVWPRDAQGKLKE